MLIYDPSLDLTTPMFPCEYGQPQERALLEGIEQAIRVSDVDGENKHDARLFDYFLTLKGLVNMG